MKKTNLILIVLVVLFVVVLGFVVWDLYLNNNMNNNTIIPSEENVKKDANTKVQSNFSDFSFNFCINNTKDNPQCKDCCDCLTGVDSETRTFCRDTCAAHDFSNNLNTTTITVPSVLGKNGNYSKCVDEGTLTCKTCCENEIGLQCGDYQYCRTACNNAFGDPKHNITAVNNS